MHILRDLSQELWKEVVFHCLLWTCHIRDATHILQGYFTGTGAIMPQHQWRNSEINTWQDTMNCYITTKSTTNPYVCFMVFILQPNHWAEMALIHLHPPHLQQGSAPYSLLSGHQVFVMRFCMATTPTADDMGTSGELLWFVKHLISMANMLRV